MFRALLTLATGIALDAGALNASHQHYDDGEKVKLLSTTDIKEKLDGTEAVATVVEVTIEPGRSGVPHRHPRSAIEYWMMSAV
jgi:quercetin dioxygenase-like cupin family protein